MDISGAEVIPAESLPINFVSADIDRSPSTDWVSVDVFHTPGDGAPTDRSSADGLSVDDVNTFSTDRLANVTNYKVLANGSSSDDIKASSTSD
jgi:hypothetical protein